MAESSLNRYSLYLDNDLNRVFTGSLPAIATTELLIVISAHDGVQLEDLEQLSDGRASLLRFSTTASADLLAALIGQLSASAALFEHQSDDRTAPLLRPVPIQQNLAFGTDLVTTQRYRGKTNERLTRVMLNCALATAGIDPAHPAGTVLDPLCGRGTTLGWATAYGLHAIGIEPEKPSLEQHGIFVETWAKRNRLPHKAQRHRSGNAEKRWLTMQVATARSALKKNEGQRIETFLSQGSDQELAIPKKSIDAIVTDFPYGIQHGGRQSPPKVASKAERFDPVALLQQMLPCWSKWLRADGSVCLAWNAKHANRDSMARAFVEAGFDPVVIPGGHSMRHVVDSTIDRDVLVARFSSRHKATKSASD